MNKNILYNRIIIFIFFMIILNIILLINIYNIQIINFKKYNLKSYRNHIKLIPIYPIRGTIFDCNGIPIATNNTYYKLDIIPDKIEDLNKMFLNLNKIIKIKYSDIKKIKKKIKNSIKYLPFTIKDNLTEKEICSLSVNKFIFSYIMINKYYKRYYPYNNVLSHVIGYLSKINKNDLKFIKKNIKNKNYLSSEYIGKIGVERYYEKLLRGKIGFKEIEINNKGKIIRFGKKIDMEHGNDIYLSIDINLSKNINSMLVNSKAAVIVTNSNNGKILSLISSPNFNPNLFSFSLNKKNFNNIFFNNNYPMLNRVTQGIYPPASTIKPYIGLYALNNKIINVNKLIFDPGWWKLPFSNKIYRDWNKKGRGWININRAIEESSDIFFYKLSYLIGIDDLYKFMLNFGYGKYINIDILEEKRGLLPNKEWKFNKFNIPWYVGDTISVGIGQGYWSVTPLQMSNSLITLINNGVEKKIHLLDSFYNYKKKSRIYVNYKIYDKNIDNNLDINVFNIIKKSMYGVANNYNGTAFNYFKNTKYKVAAKTGTAQVIKLNHDYRDKKINNKFKNHKLLISFAPFDNPKFAIVLVLENGGNGIYNIGQITKKIFDYLLKIDK